MTQTPADRYTQTAANARAYAADAITVIEAGAGDFPDPAGWHEAVDEAIGSALSSAEYAVELLAELPERPATADDVTRGAALLGEASSAWHAVDPAQPEAGEVLDRLERVTSLLNAF